MNFQFFWWSDQLVVIKLAKSSFSRLINWISPAQALVNNGLMLHNCTLAAAINEHLIEWLLSSNSLVKPLYSAHRKVIIVHVNAKVGHSHSLSIFILYTEVIFIKIFEAVLLRFIRLVASGD